MRISVVIPTYNGATFIRQAIASVLDQERRPDEIIVSDDGSTDDTIAICRSYEEISLYQNIGGPSGFVNGWNRAIALARGEYISILHQDDLLSPAFIRQGMDALERNPDVRHLFASCRYIDRQGAPLGVSYDGIGEVRFAGAAYVDAYQHRGFPHIHRCPGVITHRSIFGQCPYEPRAGHIADDDFFYRVGQFTDVIGLLEPLAAFRVHNASVTGRMEDARLAGQLMEDYLYQCRQWKGHPFLDAEAYDYFVRNAYRYTRRYIGYGVRRVNGRMVIKGIKRWMELRQL